MKRIRTMFMVLILLSGLFTGAAAPRSEPKERVPVILVHGLGGNGEAWAGFDTFLENNGYEKGRSLFILDYRDMNNGDYTVIARQKLMKAIDEAVRASGQTKVDIIASSMGGLVSRYYITSPDYRGDVRTLIMLGTPNHGSFAANLLKALRARERIPGELAVNQDDSPPAFVEEKGYVTNRAGFYLGRYLQYLKEVRFGADPAKAGNHKGFTEWLRHSGGGLHWTAILARQVPPRAKRYGDLGILRSPPRIGEDLTLAYYELLAAELAEFYLATRNAPAGTVIGRWARQASDYLTQGILPDVVQGRMDIDPDGLAIDRLTLQDIEVPSGRDKSGIPVFERIRGNYFLGFWNGADRQARKARESEPSRFFGRSLPHPNVKHVVVAGAIANIWDEDNRWGGFPTVGDNDVVVEVESAYLPPVENDVFALFSGTFKKNHISLRDVPEARRLILRHLGEFYPVSRVLSPRPPGKWFRFVRWIRTGTLEASPWEPRYVEINDGGLGGGGGEVRIEATVRKASGDGSPTFWVYKERKDGLGIEREELRMRGEAEGGSASLIVRGLGTKYSRILLGIRGGFREIGSEKTRETFRKKGTMIGYRIEFQPEGHRGSPKGQEEPEAERLSASGQRREQHDTDLGTGPDTNRNNSQNNSQNTGQGSGHGNGQAPGRDSGEDTGQNTGQDPEVLVVKRLTKATTHKEEKRTFHQHWVWEFGDGQVLMDEDPGHTLASVSHRYPAPGTYSARASSYSNQGELLRELTFPVLIPPQPPVDQPAGILKRLLMDPNKVEFQAETIQEPKVSIDIVGPKKWITGMPARFNVRVEVSDPPRVSRKVVTVDPGSEFEILWDTPGTYVIRAAVTVDISYGFPEKTIRIINTYLQSREIEVLTTASTE